MNKELFESELENIEKEIRIVEALNTVNSVLQQKNWIFLHPYSQGMDIDMLQKLSSDPHDPDKKVFTFFARKFFDLRGTIHFIEGFYNTRPFLKDYTPVIRESLVLCLQKDFRGAILMLIPVIEGTLRKYIIYKKGEHKKAEIDMKELLKAVHHLSKDYVETEKQYLKERNEVFIRSDMYLDGNQEKYILKRYRYYFDLWMAQFKNFIENNLFLNTKTGVVTDNFNRHLMYHALDDTIDYSFSNYLRIFNSLNYLSWSLGLVTEECSVLSTADEADVRNKWVDYFNVLIISEAMTEYKNNIYHKHLESFERYMDPRQIEAIKRGVNQVKQTLKWNDALRQ